MSTILPRLCEVSFDARAVWATLLSLGGLPLEDLADEVGLPLGAVEELLEELQWAGLVEVHGGTFRAHLPVLHHQSSPKGSSHRWRARGETRAKVLAALHELGEASPKVISEHAGLSHVAVQQLLYRMARAGLLINRGGRYSLPTTCVDDVNLVNDVNVKHVNDVNIVNLVNDVNTLPPPYSSPPVLSSSTPLSSTPHHPTVSVFVLHSPSGECKTSTLTARKTSFPRGDADDFSIVAEWNVPQEGTTVMLSELPAQSNDPLLDELFFAELEQEQPSLPEEGEPSEEQPSYFREVRVPEEWARRYDELMATQRMQAALAPSGLASQAPNSLSRHSLNRHSLNGHSLKAALEQMVGSGLLLPPVSLPTEAQPAAEPAQQSHPSTEPAQPEPALPEAEPLQAVPAKRQRAPQLRLLPPPPPRRKKPDYFREIAEAFREVLQEEPTAVEVRACLRPWKEAREGGRGCRPCSAEEIISLWKKARENASPDRRPYITLAWVLNHADRARNLATYRPEPNGNGCKNGSANSTRSEPLPSYYRRVVVPEGWGR